MTRQKQKAKKAKTDPSPAAAQVVAEASAQQQAKKITLHEAMREKPRRPPGRPGIYDKNFHPKSYVELASAGKTKAQICAAWGISREALDNWSKDRKNKPELLDAIKEGDDLRTAWWNNLALGIASGQIKGNPTMTIFLMKNICSKDFRDRVEHAHSLDVEEMEW